MEQPQQNPNIPPSQEGNASSPEQPDFQPEQQPVVTPEKKPKKAASPEQQTTTKDPSGSLVLPQVSDQPVVVDDTDSQKDTQGDESEFPLIADDVDVIEKEWVDKAKEIVRETKDDPYAQEEAVERLQADYLKKRYGKDIKISNQ